jgi:hypothetical protein
LGVGIDRVFIRPDGSGLTVTVSKAKPQGHIQLLVAGGVAEDRYCDQVGGKPQGEPDIYAADEWVQALAIARTLCDSPTDTFKAVEIRGELHSLVVAEIGRRWAAVSAVAHSLLTEDCLLGTAFDAILHGVTTAAE